MQPAHLALLLLSALGPLAVRAEPARPMSESHARTLHGKMVHESEPTIRNAMQMAKGLDHSQSEYVYVNAIADTSESANAAFDEFLTLAIIYQRMRCPEDRSELRSWLPENLKHAKAMLDIALDTVNQALANLTAPAVISEAQRLRGLLQFFREDLNRYSY
jgi:hypothetical protein